MRGWSHLRIMLLLPRIWAHRRILRVRPPHWHVHRVRLPLRWRSLILDVEICVGVALICMGVRWIWRGREGDMLSRPSMLVRDCWGYL